MTIDAVHFSSPQTTHLSYAVSVEQQAEDRWIAQVIGWAECQAQGRSRESAIAALREMLSDRLSRAEIIHVDVPDRQTEHPWMKHAGMYKNDPLFEEVLAEIAAYRSELDASREELAEENGDK
jgi:hypothetical protein